MNNNPQDNKAFETKVANLIAATHSLGISQILLLRRLTMADPESRRWATDRQLQVVFEVILAKAAERLGLDQLRAARDQGFLSLLPKGAEDAAAEDAQVLGEVAAKMLGNPQAPLSEHEAALEKLLTMSPRPARERTIRQVTAIKEPPPLFAAQLGPPTERQPAPGTVPEEHVLRLTDDKPFTDFATLFDDTLVALTKKVLSSFQVSETTRSERLPFLLAPTFSVCYEDVLRRLVLPQIRAARHIAQLETSYKWAELGSPKLVEIVQAGEVNNPILHNWDSRWATFRAPPGRGDDSPWPMFREDATKAQYQPPDEQHLPILRDLIRWEIDAQSKAWREIEMLYLQEFAPTGRPDPGREGVLRDGLAKWTAKLPNHVGEFLVLKAYFSFSRLDAFFLRRQVNTFGKTESDRRRNAPFLFDFTYALTG